MANDEITRTAFRIQAGLVQLGEDMGEGHRLKPPQIFTYSATYDPRRSLPVRNFHVPPLLAIQEVRENFERQGIRSDPTLSERLDDLLTEWEDLAKSAKETPVRRRPRGTSPRGL